MRPSEVRSLVEGVQRLSAVVAKLPEVVTAAQGSGFSEPCSRLLVAIRQDSPGRLDYGIANRDGRVVCTTGGTSAVRTVEGDHLRRAIASNAFLVGTFAEVRELNRRYLSFAHPVRDASGAAVGAVVTGVDLAWLAEELRNRLRVPQAVLSVHDRNLVYLLRVPDEAGLVGKPPPPSVQALSRFANQGAIDAEGADGIRRVGAINTLRFSPDALPTGDVSVAFGLAAHTAFSDVNAATYRGLALLGMSIVLAALAAMYGGRRFIGEPVSELLAAAKRWRGGDYKARVGVAERSSELGHLATRLRRDGGCAGGAGRGADPGRGPSARERGAPAPIARTRAASASGTGISRARRSYGPKACASFGACQPASNPHSPLFLDHVHPEDREKTEEHTRGVLRGQHPFDIELRTNEAKGPMRWIAAKGELISDSETGARAAHDRNLPGHHGAQARGGATAASHQRAQSPGEEHAGHRPGHRLPEPQIGRGRGLDRTLRATASRPLENPRCLTRTTGAARPCTRSSPRPSPPYSGGGAERFSVAGESVRVPPNIVVPLSMAMHELCTNAAKYGALSVPDGAGLDRLAAHEKEGAQRLVIDWRESGGPAVSEPPVRGFGTRLIERSLARQLAGDVHLQFHCDGVRCRIDVPLKPAGGTAPARPRSGARLSPKWAVTGKDLPAIVRVSKRASREDTPMRVTAILAAVAALAFVAPAGRAGALRQSYGGDLVRKGRHRSDQEAFEKAVPGVTLDVQNRNTNAGVKFLERRSQQPDGLFWASAPDAFEVLKGKNLLQQYQPKADGDSGEDRRIPDQQPGRLLLRLRGLGLRHHVERALLAREPAARAQGLERPRQGGLFRPCGDLGALALRHHPPHHRDDPAGRGLGQGLALGQGDGRQLPPDHRAVLRGPRRR
jgi:hypothetical protein